MLTAALESPGERGELLTPLRELLARVPADRLYEPVRETLIRIGENAEVPEAG